VGHQDDPQHQAPHQSHEQPDVTVGGRDAGELGVGGLGLGGGGVGMRLRPAAVPLHLLIIN
jgi:hypothetical protein